MNSKQLSWGMIGTGDVTERKSGPAFNKVEGSRLLAVCNRSYDKAVDYAARHNIETVYRTAEELISDDRINAIYIATPPDSHPGYAISAMEAGKAVYVEKPMAATYADCLRMNQASERTGSPLFVAYYRRALEYFNRVKELIDNGALGKIYLVDSAFRMTPRPGDDLPEQLPWRVIPEISGGGYFHDMACHLLDILVYIFGGFDRISGQAANRAGLYEPVDTISASGIFESGIPYSASWCFTCAEGSSKDEIVISGSTGSLVFSCFEFTPILLNVNSGSEALTVPNPENIQYSLINSITSALQGCGESPSTGQTGAYTSRIMEEILR